MKYKAIVTTNINQYTQIKDRGYCEQDEVDYTEITNTLFPVTTPFPPVDLWSLGLGVERGTIGTPHHAIDKIEFIEPSEINIELTEKVNSQLAQLTENWESFLFLEFFKSKIYETQWSKGVEDINLFLSDWSKKNGFTSSMVNHLLNEVNSISQKTKNYASRMGYLFIIKKEGNHFLVESKQIKNFKTAKYRGNTEWWWLEEKRNANRVDG